MGIFIVFEGGEGSGKTTQAKMLAKCLDHSLLTKEPGSPHSVVCTEIRKLLLNPEYSSMVAKTEALLFYADRAQHLEEVVRPALARGDNVIQDRYFYSTRAYQVAGRGLDPNELLPVHNYVVNLLPDIVFLLDVDPLVGLKRKIAQDELTRMENEKLEFHQLVNQAFRDYATADTNRWIVLDGTLSEDVLAEKIWQEVSGRI